MKISGQGLKINSQEIYNQMAKKSHKFCVYLHQAKGKKIKE